MSRIEELKALEKAATAGGWHHEFIDETGNWYIMVPIRWPEGQAARTAICTVNDRCPITSHQAEHNAELIVEMRKTLPALLEIAERAKEYVADSNARRDNYRRLAYCTELAAALEKL